MIGVYLGRPFEGWSYEKITRELGEINAYVNDRLRQPLVVSDDDLSGTFGFLRCLPDHGLDPALTAAQIGDTWLNYIIENRTILWWGGVGNSTEHTAYINLKRGIPAPRSGSIELNGSVVAEQIGAQIFIDGWGLINPGDPARAADFAARAARVSHDGEAVYGARVVAALVAAAFVEQDLQRLLDLAVAEIPPDCLIARLIADLRAWHATGEDWRSGFARIEERYGYARYGGGCHMVPNHALIIHALLHGGGDFHRSLAIVNTCGWDTDCNSGNIGCILGVRNGLAGIDRGGPNWRGPVRDRLFLPTAEGGETITDAVRETVNIVDAAYRLRGQAGYAPKNGARFHFSFPGSVQGFRSLATSLTPGLLDLSNEPSETDPGTRILMLRYARLGPGQTAAAATGVFLTGEEQTMRGYGLLACPTLYSGQTIQARMAASRTNIDPVSVRLFADLADGDTSDRRVRSEPVILVPGSAAELTWQAPESDGQPFFQLGLELAASRFTEGAVALEWLRWSGAPDTMLKRAPAGERWKTAWIEAADRVSNWSKFSDSGPLFEVASAEKTGLVFQGTREWRDYRLEAGVKIKMAEESGLVVRVQGLNRYYALVLGRDGFLRLVKCSGARTVLAEAPFVCQWHMDYRLTLEVRGTTICGSVDNGPILRAVDEDATLGGGAAGFLVTAGTAQVMPIRIQPA